MVATNGSLRNQFRLFLRPGLSSRFPAFLNWSSSAGPTVLLSCCPSCPAVQCGVHLARTVRTDGSETIIRLSCSAIPAEREKHSGGGARWTRRTPLDTRTGRTPISGIDDRGQPGNDDAVERASRYTRANPTWLGKMNDC